LPSLTNWHLFRFCLRRAVFRARSASYPSVPKTRTITTLTTSPFRRNTSRYLFPVQRRFASEEATRVEESGVEHASEAQPEATNEASASEEHHASSSEQTTATSAVSSATESLVRNASEATNTVAEAAQTVREYAADAASTVGASAGVTSAIAGSGQGLQQQAQPKTELYVGNLFFDVSEEALRREMERFGPLKSVRIIYDPRGLSKG
jgi:nucleolin